MNDFDGSVMEQDIGEIKGSMVYQGISYLMRALASEDSNNFWRNFLRGQRSLNGDKCPYIILHEDDSFGDTDNRKVVFTVHRWGGNEKIEITEPDRDKLREAIKIAEAASLESSGRGAVLAEMAKEDTIDGAHDAADLTIHGRS